MDLKGIMVSQISQKDKDKTNAVSSHLYVKSKRAELLETNIGVNTEDVSQMVWTSSYEMSNFWGSNVQCGDYHKNTVLPTWMLLIE